MKGTAVGCIITTHNGMVGHNMDNGCMHWHDISTMYNLNIKVPCMALSDNYSVDKLIRKFLSGNITDTKHNFVIHQVVPSTGHDGM